MKILLFSTFYYPKTGGVEFSARSFSKNFKKKGHSVEVITKKHEKGLKDKEIIDGIKVHRMSFIKKTNKNFYAYGIISLISYWRWMIRNRKKFLDFDIIMFNDWSSFYWYLPLKILHKKPDVIFYYGYDEYNVSARYKILRKITKRFTEKNVCGGKYLDKHYGFSCDHYFYTGVEKVSKIDMRKKKNKIIFAGRFSPDTSILNYLKSMKILKEKYDLEIRLDVYGNGPLKKKAHEFSKKNKLNVKFYGWVPNARRFFKKYKFSFSTQWGSLMDCFRTKTLAFSLCTLPLTLDYDKELLQNGKLGIISKTPEELAEKFSYYQDNKKRVNKILEEGYKFAKNTTWDKVADKAIKIFRETLNEKRKKF